MTVTATAKRRRKQARNDFTHLPKLGRPRYPARSRDAKPGKAS